jgi:mannosyltransferase
MLQLDVVRSAPAAGHDRARTHAALILGIVGTAVGFAGSWIPSYWGDEAASVLSATRTWPSLVALLGHVDGVHGVYYALLSVWVDVFGTSEVATRALSAIAVGAMVAGTVVLAREFVGARVAVWAGVVAIVLPRTTFMAAEARSYALGSAAAVWAAVLLVRLLRRPGASRRAWLAYAVVIAACTYVFLYLGLLLVVHGAYVALRHRTELRRWAAAAGLALVFSIPILVAGYHERRQIRFLEHRHYATAAHVLTKQWFGYPLLAVVGWMLMAGAIAWLVYAARRRTPGRAGRVSLTVLAALWVVLPTAALLIVDATISPVYNVRYLSFGTPAVAIMIALGVSAAAGVVADRRRALTAVAILGAVVVLSAPAYVGQRTPWAKDGGSDLRGVADYVRANATAGDAVVFDETTKPSRDPRLALDLYPDAFAGLRDVALATPYGDRARLWDRTVPNAQAAASATQSPDIWAVELTRGSAVPTDVALLEDLGYEVASAHVIHRSTVYHLVRE